MLSSKSQVSSSEIEPRSCSSLLWVHYYCNNQPGHLEKCEDVIPHFWAKIAQNHTILAKLHYYELFGKKPFFHTFGPELHFFTLFGKIHTSLKQNRPFSNFSRTFPDALISMPRWKYFRHVSLQWPIRNYILFVVEYSLINQQECVITIDKTRSASLLNIKYLKNSNT